MTTQEPVSGKDHFAIAPSSHSTESITRMDRWMATLAHELRDPLNAIVLALEELHPVCAHEPEAQLAREMARNGAGQMRRIIEDILDLCRCRRGNLAVRMEQVDLGKVVAAAINNARPLLVGRSHLLTVSLPPEHVSFEAHPSRMEQIVTNLLVNAAKYTQFGGRIRLTAEVFGDDLVLRVRDNGIGIAPDLLPHVFEPYRRGFVLPPHDGLGLGLALVKSLVDLHGGTVTACSDGPGKGSEFVVRLPREYRPTSSLTADSANANHDRPMCSKTID
jgi:signal transduction histidine kinase